VGLRLDMAREVPYSAYQNVNSWFELRTSSPGIAPANVPLDGPRPERGMPIQERGSQVLVKTAAKALDVLECLALADSPLTAQEVAERCGLSRPTAYRLLRTLGDRGFTMTAGQGRYALGTKILRLSRHVLDGLEIGNLAKSVLRKLRQQTNEMSLVAIRDRDTLFYIGKYETTHAVRMHTRTGSVGHLHATALGKAILAFLPHDEQGSLLAELALPPVTAKTVTGRQELEAELLWVRQVGYALEDEENEAEIRSVAAPVFNHMGEVIGALGTSGPAYRLDMARLEEIAPFVVAAAAEVSAALGCVRGEGRRGGSRRGGAPKRPGRRARSDS
jgi:IclR family KDG regulon transcriptional repressor